MVSPHVKKAPFVCLSKRAGDPSASFLTSSSVLTASVNIQSEVFREVATCNPNSDTLIFLLNHNQEPSSPVVFNLGYTYPRGHAKTSYINQNGAQEQLEP
jgi:hypothetical protein